MKKQSTFDLHQTVTTTILEAIEKGTTDFKLPWLQRGPHLLMPRNVESGKSYSGINTVIMWCVAESKNYPTAEWSTYAGWGRLGAHVRKGEKATPVVFYKSYPGTPDPDDPSDDGTRRVAKHTFAFNRAQVDGYETGETQDPLPPLLRIERAEAFIRAIPIPVRHGGDRAFYSPLGDYVQMPPAEAFIGVTEQARTEAYYSALSHELTHGSGHPKRLNRQFGKNFGDLAYAAEEVVAQLGACFICAELGISVAPREDDAAYIGHWLKILKADNRHIFTAAAKASEAVRYLTSFSSSEEANHAEAA